MKTMRPCFHRSLFLKPLYLLIFLLIFAIPGLQAQSPLTIEIQIKDGRFYFESEILKPDQEVTLLVRNDDLVQHGFTSPFFEEFEIEVEVDGVVTFGKGLKGVHIEPGSVLSIRFTPTRSGNFSFQCDLHPGMKGEMAVLTFGAV